MPCEAAKPAILVYGKQLGRKLTVCTDSRFGFEATASLILPGVPATYFQALAFVGQTPSAQVHYHDSFASSGLVQG